MRLVFFKTPKARKYGYQPRYYDPKKEEWERRKAELGYKSELSKDEQLRMKMSGRWQKDMQADNKRAPQILTYFIYAVFIFGSIYVILFTNLVENFLKLFGLVAK